MIPPVTAASVFEMPCIVLLLDGLYDPESIMTAYFETAESTATRIAAMSDGDLPRLRRILLSLVLVIILPLNQLRNLF